MANRADVGLGHNKSSSESASDVVTKEGAQTLTTNHDQSSNGHPPAGPPLRPPRGHTNLVQPKHELRPPPAATPPAKGRTNGVPAAVAGGGVVGVRKSTCPQCSNISIMRLFYQMKQLFPTVSDDVVNECVLDYCHQRERCVAALQEHSESNQTLIPQSYPSKLLRGSFENILGGSGGAKKKTSLQHNQEEQEKKQSKGDKTSNTNTFPRRSKAGGGVGSALSGMVGGALVQAAVPLVGMVNGGVGCELNKSNGSFNFRRQSDTNSPKQQQQSIAGGGLGNNTNNHNDVLSNGGSFISNNIQRMAIGNSGGVVNKLERPSTLNLSPAPNRPFRAAPPIPSTTSSTSSLSSLSTATDLASASSPQLTASNESINVSVNVTLSPVIGHRVGGGGGAVSRPPIPPPRHTTELTVQPELLPFATTSAGTAGGMPTRSFTSVNFTLRPPATGADGAEGTSTAPIDISTAGSSMTYSSSSYNAKQGYQSQLQITVGNGGGSISAIRTKAPTPVTPTNAVAGSSLMRDTRNLMGGGTTTRLDADTEEVLVNRQLQSKWKLSTELEKYRKRLDVMQRDIRVLEMPLPSASAPDQLQEEIKRLQTVCDRMAAAVEEAGNFALGETNEAFYQRLDSQLPGSSASSNTTPTQQRVVASNPTSTTTTTVPGSPATSRSWMAEASSSGQNNNNNNHSNDELEIEGWTCSQCTFQNHPELNTCEQCGMMRQIHRPQLQQQPLSHHQQQQHVQNRSHHQQHPSPGTTTSSHMQPPGIVQITSSQYIPALAPNSMANQNPAHLGAVPTNMSPYMMQGYNHQHHHPMHQQPPPMMIYSQHQLPQYPQSFGYPMQTHISPTASISPGQQQQQQQQLSPLTPPVTSGSGSTRSKGKRGGKFNIVSGSENIRIHLTTTGQNHVTWIVS